MNNLTKEFYEQLTAQVLDTIEYECPECGSIINEDTDFMCPHCDVVLCGTECPECGGAIYTDSSYIDKCINGCEHVIGEILVTF